MHSPEPIVLLWDPGTGKTMTVRSIALEIAQAERRRAYPNIPVLAGASVASIMGARWMGRTYSTTSRRCARLRSHHTSTPWIVQAGSSSSSTAWTR